MLVAISIGKRNNLSLADLWLWVSRLYSSIMFSTSSSDVTVISASRSSLGSWYFMFIFVESDSLESLVRREEKLV